MARRKRGRFSTGPAIPPKSQLAAGPHGTAEAVGGKDEFDSRRAAFGVAGGAARRPIGAILADFSGRRR
jgi:hypothetical protein